MSREGPIAIVSVRADAYAETLRSHLPNQRFELCRSIDESPAAIDRCEIALGDPNLLASLLSRMPNLRWIQSTWAGVTPLTDELRRDYRLTGVQGIFGQAITEYVTAQLLHFTQRLTARARAQAERQWWPEPSMSLSGRRLLILGTGSIGSALANRLTSAFDLACYGMNSNGRQVEGFTACFTPDALHEQLAQCDFLVNTLPDTAATRGLLSAAAISQLRDHAFFVNVGRGSVVDPAALAKALAAGSLAGAALDVFEQEPLPQDSELWGVPNLAISAHIAALTRPGDIVPIFAENLSRYRSGRDLLYEINFERGY